MTDPHTQALADAYAAIRAPDAITMCAICRHCTTRDPAALETADCLHSVAVPLKLASPGPTARRMRTLGMPCGPEAFMLELHPVDHDQSDTRTARRGPGKAPR